MKNTKIRNKSNLPKTCYSILLIVLDLCVIIPFVYMALLALMEDNYSRILSFKRIKEATFSLQNFINVFTANNFDRYLLNSVIVAVLGAFISVLISTMAAYAFAKKRFPGRKTVQSIYSMTMMIPTAVMTVPLFLIVKKMGLYGSYFGLSIPVFSGAFGTLLIYSFMKSVPDELLESAELDGCGEIGKFFRIVVPLVKSAMLSVAIFAIISAWGQLLWPQVIAPKQDMSTVTAAIARMTGGDDMNNYGYIMAASTLGFIPPLIVYGFLQKQFIESIAASGIKG